MIEIPEDSQTFEREPGGVECCCCPKIDHACGAAIKIHYRHRICDAVCANCFRVFVPHFDAGLDAYINNKWVLFKIFPAGLYHATGKLRYNRCKADPFQIPERMICALQKPLELQAVFIRHAGVICGEPPMRAQDVAAVQTQCNVRIADVNCKKHKASIHVNKWTCKLGDLCTCVSVYFMTFSMISATMSNLWNCGMRYTPPAQALSWSINSTATSTPTRVPRSASPAASIRFLISSGMKMPGTSV